MKMSFLALASLAFVSNAVAQDQNETWGYVRQTYTLGSSQLVAKDQGSLEINLQLTCVENTADVSKKMADLAGKVADEVKKESRFTVKTTTPETSTSSDNLYDIRYDEKDIERLSPFYVNVCKNDEQVTISGVDLTKRVFQVAATLKVETKEALADLTSLRQKLQAFAERNNTENPTAQIYVQQENISVSAEKRQKAVSQLVEQNRLVGTLAKTSRLGLDRALAEDFTEFYITSVDTDVDGFSEYLQYNPTLTPEGKSKVQVPYNFAVQYRPGNIGTNDRATSEKQRGTLSETYVGEAVVDTDYYVAHLSFSTGCQAKAEDAIAATSDLFAQFKTAAQSVVKSDGTNPYERIEETINTPQQDNKWQVWERQLNAQNQPVAKSYIRLCDGKVVSEVTKEDQTYGVTHTLTLVTNNFAGLKTLEAEAIAATEAQRSKAGAQRVEVQLGGITPRLKDEKQFEAVEILAYHSAVGQLIAPQGETAKRLLDEIQADEAYYSVTRGNMPSRRGEFADARPSPGGASPADAYKVVVASEGNIPMTEIRANSTYSVTYKPNKNLVQILKEARAGANRLP